MDGLEKYSHPELRERLYRRIRNLLEEDPAEYRRAMKIHVNTLQHAGLINTLDGRPNNMSERGKKEWGNSRWIFTHGGWNKN